MAIVAAWWGIWHIVAGLSLATFWSKRPPILQSPAAASPSLVEGGE
jgi:BASS family bile acid:Na+ symporter